MYQVKKSITRQDVILYVMLHSQRKNFHWEVFTATANDPTAGFRNSLGAVNTSPIPYI